MDGMCTSIVSIHNGIDECNGSWDKKADKWKMHTKTVFKQYA